MNKKYPFDPSIKHHLIIALGLLIWIFIFLYFTEPFDVNELVNSEKIIYLPGYGIVGGLLYLISLPFQYWLFNRNKKTWTLALEGYFLIFFTLLSILLIRLFYLQFVVNWHPNAHDLSYHIFAIILPALLTILPIIIFGRFAFGKYKNKKTEAQKIEIKGEGNYEGLRLFLNDIICIQSSDNYIEVFYLSGNDLKKSLIRNKLSVIADEFPQFLRTHRSYIINPFHFLQWKTENSKLFVVLFHHIEVPVSRTYQNDVKAVLNSTTELLYFAPNTY
ncbi:LytTR family DNA-binding domain-containing protein [Tenacibaculum sp. 1_MG-2023]|uniref:LytTR family DNA-binding domain-containing protein n=1 Tax=Tenacibaculum sp. 1_MG-2023 TaxID=3062653 RepID=UPI0026E135F9|nr:LytTR family DNA-binding domain-containing protein [Tenacibaculum sp. 1_MG-2023]MDO6599763.1 LytTR family DNA-binding domain-containing protein [Tenacibaculum sp. 1_MG-2023]